MYIRINTTIDCDGIKWYYHTERKELIAFFTFSDCSHFKIAHPIKPINGLRVIDSILMKIGESFYLYDCGDKASKTEKMLLKRW